MSEIASIEEIMIVLTAILRGQKEGSTARLALGAAKLMLASDRYFDEDTLTPMDLIFKDLYDEEDEGEDDESD